MSYIEIKKIKNLKYKYERTSYRVGDKVKHRSKYIGPVEPKNRTKKGGGKHGFQKKKWAPSSAFKF